MIKLLKIFLSREDGRGDEDAEGDEGAEGAVVEDVVGEADRRKERGNAENPRRGLDSTSFHQKLPKFEL